MLIPKAVMHDFVILYNLNLALSLDVSMQYAWITLVICLPFSIRYIYDPRILFNILCSLPVILLMLFLAMSFMFM